MAKTIQSKFLNVTSFAYRRGMNLISLYTVISFGINVKIAAGRFSVCVKLVD